MSGTSQRKTKPLLQEALPLSFPPQPQTPPCLPWYYSVSLKAFFSGVFWSGSLHWASYLHHCACKEAGTPKAKQRWWLPTSMVLGQIKLLHHTQRWHALSLSSQWFPLFKFCLSLNLNIFVHNHSSLHAASVMLLTNPTLQGISLHMASSQNRKAREDKPRQL